LNSVGIIAAIITFITIAFGHVMVREVEYRIVRLQAAIFLVVLVGIGFEIASFFVQTNALSAVLGIMGITFLWDGLEFYRQQKRVIKGHAPANRKNARHQRILAQYPAATTVSLLNRDPRGYPYSEDEIQNILGGVANPEGDQHE